MNICLERRQRVDRERFVGEVYGRLFSTVNLVGFLLQMFVVARVFKFLGIGRALFIHPLVALIGSLLLLRSPSLRLMGLVKIADNSLDYSLGNTVKQVSDLLWRCQPWLPSTSSWSGRGLAWPPC